MARITELKRIQKQHTEEQMRKALQDFINGKHRLRVPVDDDDPDVVLADTINELLEARAIIQAVVERDPGIASEIDGEIYCFYCGGDKYDNQPPKVTMSDLYHLPDCAYLKTRKLLETLGKGI